MKLFGGNKQPTHHINHFSDKPGKDRHGEENNKPKEKLAIRL
jgi:hypothetical protein